MAFAIPLAVAAFPETLASIGLTSGVASTASSILGGFGAISSALGSIQQGKAAKDSANYNAKVQENNAQIAKNNAEMAAREGAANTAIQQQKTRAGVAGIKAAQAANGIDVNSGSAVDVRSSAAELGELNAITVRSNAVKQAYGYQTQAASDQAQAQLDRQQGKFAEKSGYINAGTTLLSKGTEGYQSGLWGDYNKKKSLGGDEFYGPSNLPWQNEFGYGS